VLEVEDPVYVYGVSLNSNYAPVSVPGVQDAEVEAVEHADLVAFASHLHQTNLAARDLRAHWRVLENAFDHGTVLPVRFGTVMETPAAVRLRLLEPNAERLSELLREMTGLVQLNLKGRYDEDSLLREIVRSNPAVASLRERIRAQPEASKSPADQIALGQLVEREVTQRSAEDGAIARSMLEPLAVAVREEQVGHPNAFNLAFLVNRERTDEFSDAVSRLRQQLGERIEIRYVGPLPPFSFAETDLNTGSPTWA
jgi:hypothetical protein